MDSGLLDQLHLSCKHVLPYQERSRLLADIKVSEVRGEAKGREAERLQVALAMKVKGIEVGVIAEVTGLSVTKVKGLKAPPPKRSAGGKAKGVKGSKR